MVPFKSSQLCISAPFLTEARMLVLTKHQEEEEMAQQLIQSLNRIANKPRTGVLGFTPWIIYAVVEMCSRGVWELYEVELALKYNIGLGPGGLPLIVQVDQMHSSPKLGEIDDDQSGQILSCVDPIIDLDVSFDEENASSPVSSPIPLDQIESEPRPEETDDEQAVLIIPQEEPIIDLTLSSDEENVAPLVSRDLNNNIRKSCKRKMNRATQKSSGTKRIRSDQIICLDDSIEEIVEVEKLPSDNVMRHNFAFPANGNIFTERRIGVYCPRPYQQRLMNAIANQIDKTTYASIFPKFNRNGASLDTMWFLAANFYSASWMISTVKEISKQPNWRNVDILVEPWNENFVVKNVISLLLPWTSKGVDKRVAFDRLRQANSAHGSRRWNLIRCKRVRGRNNIVLRMAVSRKTLESLNRTQFNVFYGLSQYRCKIVHVD
ncbi:uncharacterized protein LOC129738889 [Uranotaenia lowii]|uniref:uncharacterized protein LOC129738889 n=1 Tax=Uranotaenia lowii TaxID=190385 RepID=UPI00247923DF|nr:uncharacterized protein LOC129738889 [Uranotaenia lowii]